MEHGETLAQAARTAATKTGMSALSTVLKPPGSRILEG